MKRITHLAAVACISASAALLCAQQPPREDSPLHTAARNLQPEIVERLIKDGTAVKGATSRGETALHLALTSGDALPETQAKRGRIVEMLLAAGLDASTPDDEGLTPLHVAAVRGRVEALPALLAAKVDVNASDKVNRTPLHYAAQGGHKAVIEQLLARGATVDAKDQLGETPLHVAARRFRTPAAEQLIAAGAAVNARNAKNQTPLHLLCQSKGERVGAEALNAFADALISHGAEINVRDADKKTPLTYAIDSECEKLADLLRQHGGEQ